MTIALVLLAAVAAVLSYRLLDGWGARTWLPAACRAVGWGTVALLLVNASCPSSRLTGRPLVLLDGSLSMQVAGGRWREADSLARRTGDVRMVGAVPGDSTASGGRTELAGAIIAAQSGGRPVVVVTDGEAEDADAIPADVLGSVSVRVLERKPAPDVALVRVSGTTRLTVTDSVRIDAEVQAYGGTPSAALALEVREGTRTWFRHPLVLDAAGRGRVTMTGPLPSVPPGVHVLTVAVTGGSDAEPRDDARWLVLTVVPTPGVVLLASPPTWESRFLLESLRDVSALPVRGYFETERGKWRRSGDLKPVPTSEVAEAARRADLLVTLGDAASLTRGTRARAQWAFPATIPRPGAAGDWYLSVPPASPLGGAFAGLAVDSFPPGTAITELAPLARDWVGLNAQAGRRGTVRPVLIGRDSGNVRKIVVAVDGLWRWAFQGGSSEQGYRALIAASVSWLLGGADSAAGKARLAHDVVQRGRPVVFEWAGAGPATALAIGLDGPGGARNDSLRFDGAGRARNDSLRFDGAGRAQLFLAPGVWHYRIGAGNPGTLAVEEFSDEWLPAARTLSSHDATVVPSSDRIPVRRWLWLFGVAVTAFAGEWFARRRLGLR